MNRTVAALGLGSLLFGCVEPKDPDLDVVVEDSAGVQLVRNLSSTVHLLSTQEVLRIGTVSGHPETLFHNVGSVDVYSDGSILVTNAGSTIREYSPEGRFITEFGRRGEGPGEFGILTQAVGVGDTVVALSVNPARITLFTREGELLTSFNLEPIELYGGIDILDGRVLYYSGPLPSASQGELVRSTRAYREFDLRTGALSSTKFTLPGVLVLGHGGQGPILDQARNGVVLPGGRYLITPGEAYRMEIRSWAGNLERVVTRAFNPVPITQRDLDRFEEATRRRFHVAAGFPGIEQEIRLALRRSPPGEHIPPIRSVAVAEDGSLWVHRQDLHDDPFERALAWEVGAEEGYVMPPSTYDGFDPEGKYRGSVRLHPDFRPRIWGSDFVLGVATDDLDVEYVVRQDIGSRQN